MFDDFSFLGYKVEYRNSATPLRLHEVPPAEQARSFCQDRDQIATFRPAKETALSGFLFVAADSEAIPVVKQISFEGKYFEKSCHGLVYGSLRADEKDWHGGRSSLCSSK